MSPLCVEETGAEQVLGLGFQDQLTLQDWGQIPPFFSDIPRQPCSPLCPPTLGDFSADTD